MKVAVIIPCYNEELTIAKVVADYRRFLPEAEIFVCDNSSQDATRAVAEAAGACVIEESRKGKGYALQTLFRRVNADIYVLVDGDDTYPAAKVRELLDPVLQERADMVVGSRLMVQESKFRSGNRFGNILFAKAVNLVFGAQLTDIFSGYRVFQRSVAEGIPLFSSGFEVETELTIKALDRRLRIVEIPVELSERPEGSFSKLKRVKDGVRISWTILKFLRDYKPLTFFGSIALFCAAAGMLMPSALALHLMALVSCQFMLAGLLLHSLTHRFREVDSLIRSNQVKTRNSVPAAQPSTQTSAEASRREAELAYSQAG